MFFFSFICLFPFYIIKYWHPWLTSITSSSDAASARYFPDGDRTPQHRIKDCTYLNHLKLTIHATVKHFGYYHRLYGWNWCERDRRPVKAPLIPREPPPRVGLPQSVHSCVNRVTFTVTEPCGLRKPLQKKVDLHKDLGFSDRIVFKQLRVLCARLR